MRAPVLLLAATLCSCGKTPEPSGAVQPPPAHLVSSDEVPVSGAPEPEVVQLKKIEDVGEMKHVTVGNVAGDYVLVCNLDANK